MSLINQVLQDLEARRGGLEGRRLPDEVRALPPQRRRTVWPWLLLATLGCTALAAFLMWPEAAPVAPVVAPHPVVMAEPAVPEIMVAPVPPVLAPQAAPATKNAAADGSRKPATVSVRPPVQAPKAAAPQTTAPERSDASVVVSKEVRLPTPRERANSEYAKAVTALNQGHREQAAAALRAAIKEDPAWAPPRQALLGLLLEQQRLADAEELLRQGVAQNPTQIDLAMQLARLQVERKDFNGALESLQRIAAQAVGNADYHGLDAAVLQRLGRHREALAAYQEGLRLAPQNGVWWMGFGISLEAEGRLAEANEAYRRARDSGTLNAELLNFIEQKLKGGAIAK